jgi:predicted NBD/HSP70 family sugar kinase
MELGVDVGGTSVRVVARCPDGSRTEVLTRPVPAGYDDFLGLLEVLAAALAGACAPAGTGGAPAGTGGAPAGTGGASAKKGGALAGAAAAPEAVVIGLPGAVGDPAVRWVPALSWLDGRTLAADVGRRLGAARVRVANDAQLALLGEVREGAARGAANAVLVSVGTGVGGAILLDGRIVTGAHGTAGSFGWLPSAGVTATDDHGALELAASGRALDRLAIGTTTAANGAGDATGPDLIAAARAGDPAACAALDGWATALGTGIAGIASILDPEVVVLSGGLAAVYENYAEPLRAAVRAAGSPDGRRVPVVPAALGPHAGVIGALHAANTLAANTQANTLAANTLAANTDVEVWS